MPTRTRTVCLSLAVACTLLPWRAEAVPLGTVDSSEYPYVGLVSAGFTLGSGVLVAPDVVLTAGHVADSFQGGSSIFVTGSDPLQFVDSLVDIVDSVVHPLYDASAFSSPIYDYGLLFLEQAITGEYATLLPGDPASLLGRSFEVVGYGGSLERRVDSGAIRDVQGNLLLSDPIVEPGDSGGGLFVEVDGQNVLAGINSFKFFDTDYFVSVGYARDFIDQYVDASWYGESSVSDPPVAVAEPSPLSILALGLLALAATRLRVRRPSSLDAAAA